jgi:hypothetical protein
MKSGFFLKIKNYNNVHLLPLHLQPKEIILTCHNSKISEIKVVKPVEEKQM